MTLTEEMYRLTKFFPREEQFGLVSQLRRSAVSIASNSAEGHARNTRGEFIQFLGQAIGSSAEVYTQLVISRRIELTTYTEFVQSFQLLDEVQLMLVSLIRSLKKGR